jgi:hypothetical protein
MVALIDFIFLSTSLITLVVLVLIAVSFFKRGSTEADFLGVYAIFKIVWLIGQTSVLFTQGLLFHFAAFLLFIGVVGFSIALLAFTINTFWPDSFRRGLIILLSMGVALISLIPTYYTYEIVEGTWVFSGTLVGLIVLTGVVMTGHLTTAITFLRRRKTTLNEDVKWKYTLIGNAFIGHQVFGMTLNTLSVVLAIPSLSSGMEFTSLIWMLLLLIAVR